MSYGTITAGTIDGENLTLSGNLTVNGTTTTIDTSTLTVEDKNIELGKVTTPSKDTANGGGITLKADSDKTIKWIKAAEGFNDYWEFNQDIETSGAVRDSKGNLRSLPQNSQAGAYELVPSDAGKHIEAVGTITIPNNIFSEGDMVTIVNNSAGDITLTKTITTMYLASDGSNTNRTLASRGMCTILFMGGTEAFISGAGLS